MNVTSLKLIYFSPTQTTKKTMEGIAEGIGIGATETIDLTLPDAQTRDFEDLTEEMAIIGVPVYAGRVPEVAALADEVVKIRVEGLDPAQTITLRASLKDDLDQPWNSYATFVSDETGVVDVTTQAPISGTYDFADPMGLFWSMLPDNDSFYANGNTDFILVTITAEVENEQIGTTYVNRIRLQQGVNDKWVDEDGLVGRFFFPDDEKPHPTVIILGGSGGGMDIGKATLLASHGYAALALDYFGNPPLPEYLVEIPLEYFETAIEWLKSQEVVDEERIGVIGSSRGGELALLLGATFSDLKAIVGYAPNSFAVRGVTNSGGVDRPAWTYQGNPLPFAIAGNMASFEAAAIPVEKISGSILLISGKDDGVWPSTEASEIAIERLTERNHPFTYEHFSYEDAGHAIGVPHVPTTVTQFVHPVTGTVLELGGTASGNAFASADSWKHLLEFLENNLKNLDS